jgi:Lar family restriction alleviation protein
MTPTLKHCPFCGDRPRFKPRSCGEAIQIECLNCGVEGPHFAMGDTWPTSSEAEAAAAEAWNERYSTR